MSGPIEPDLLFCTVRDGGDEWHIECRFSDGQKLAAIRVDKEFEKLADDIMTYLNATAHTRHIEKGMRSSP